MSHIQSKIGLLSSLYTSQVVPVGFFYLTLPVFFHQEAVGLLLKSQDIQVFLLSVWRSRYSALFSLPILNNS
jgi:hypothetical protein